MNPKHQAQIERLERQAARHPDLYRLRVGVVAIGGDILLTAAQIVPWMLPIAFGVLLLNHPAFYGLGAVVLVFFIYLVRPTLRLEGRPLTREEAPALFAQIDAMRDRLKVRQRMEVMLDDSFNAAALETRGLFGFLGVRRILILGVPLLATMPREEVLAVIAHEFGHFSHRHGRLGHWLYRARAGWIEFEDHVRESDMVFDKSVAWLAARLTPYFTRISFVHARRCEYEADADAALVCGGKTFGDALTRVRVLGRAWADGFQRRMAAWRQEEKDAPANLYERFAEAAMNWPGAELERWRREALREGQSWLDTHPRLADRLAALKLISEPVKPATGGGAELLGASWPVVLGEFNAKWRDGVAWDWAFEHLRFTHLLAPLIGADEAVAAQWPLADRLARARALRSNEPEKGLAELRQLHSQVPDDNAVTFAYGAALLNQDDAAGVTLLENLAVENPTFRVPVYARLIRFFSRKDDEESGRWRERLVGAAMRRAVAIKPFLAKAERGRAKSSSLPPAAIAVLGEAMALDPCVGRAWLFEGREPLGTAQSEHAADLEIQVLVLTLDPKALDRASADEDFEKNRYLDAIESLARADAAVVVVGYFTTQPIPEDLDRAAPLFDRRNTAT